MELSYHSIAQELGGTPAFIISSRFKLTELQTRAIERAHPLISNVCPEPFGSRDRVYDYRYHAILCRFAGAETAELRSLIWRALLAYTPAEVPSITVSGRRSINLDSPAWTTVQRKLEMAQINVEQQAANRLKLQANVCNTSLELAAFVSSILTGAIIAHNARCQFEQFAHIQVRD